MQDIHMQLTFAEHTYATYVSRHIYPVDGGTTHTYATHTRTSNVFDVWVEYIVMQRTYLAKYMQHHNPMY
jgi:hypothetical protein